MKKRASAKSGRPSIPLKRLWPRRLKEGVQVGLLSLGEVIASHAMSLLSKYSLLVRILSKNSIEAWGASAGSRIAAGGIQMDAGGECKNEVRADFFTGRNVRPLFHSKGAHSRLLGRPNGMANGTLLIS